MQGDIQKWVDHSISVTVNIPETATEELVSQIYQKAWESGCKGMTIYRDGSRSGVLVSNDKKGEASKDDFIETKAPPRPRIIEADVIRFQNNYEKWLAVIGKINDKPYEVFTGKAEDFYLPPYVETGWVVKVKNKGERTRYDFQFEDKQGYRITVPALSRSFEQEFWNYAKLISGVLRHGMPLTYVIDLISNLNFPEDNINTWRNGVVRSLKRYIPDGTQAVDTICPACGENTVVYEDGCLICKSCGHSKCS
jgi:ribonucleoside-diphosphate reductase alpha chain